MKNYELFDNWNYFKMVRLRLDKNYLSMVRNLTLQFEPSGVFFLAHSSKPTVYFPNFDPTQIFRDAHWTHARGAINLSHPRFDQKHSFRIHRDGKCK